MFMYSRKLAIKTCSSVESIQSRQRINDVQCKTTEYELVGQTMFFYDRKMKGIGNVSSSSETMHKHFPFNCARWTTSNFIGRRMKKDPPSREGTNKRAHFACFRRWRSAERQSRTWLNRKPVSWVMVHTVDGSYSRTGPYIRQSKFPGFNKNDNQNLSGIQKFLKHF